MDKNSLIFLTRLEQAVLSREGVNWGRSASPLRAVAQAIVWRTEVSQSCLGIKQALSDKIAKSIEPERFTTDGALV